MLAMRCASSDRMVMANLCFFPARTYTLLLVVPLPYSSFRRCVWDTSMGATINISFS